ncbi:MAG: glycoside hydrolase family 3 N-terminal domain-containing protein [Pseudomonadota bacterium]
MAIGACILSVSGPALLANERAFLKEANPWGVILMGRSCETIEQIQALITDIQSATGRATLIFIDQEGGRVARLRPPVWPKFPPAALYGELYRHDPSQGVEACRLGYQLLGGELTKLGIRADCAPVCDLGQPGTHDSIGDRAFGDRLDMVVELANAALSGLRSAGVLGCIKHMPGQGRAMVDSHHDLPSIDADVSELEQDFSVFSGVKNAALMGMTGHVCLEAIAPGEAATVSNTVISDVIRGRIGFDGLLMTDDLGMQALGGTLANRGERALAAGCDILLHCSGFLKDPDAILNEMVEVAGAAGTLSGKALIRAEAAYAAIPDSVSYDQEAAWAEFNRLLEPALGGKA